MGTIKKGILGSFSGKVGTVVGATWKGISYIRSLPASMRNPKTRKQLTQRSKFSMVGKFVRAALPLVQVGFGRADSNNSAYGVAMGVNIQNAVKGEYPDFAIDYGKVALSRGNLQVAANVAASFNDGKLNVSWDADLEGNASATDRVCILAYNPARQRAVYDLEGTTRAGGGSMMTLPSLWAGEKVEVFVVFVALDSSLVSETVYAGELTVIAG